MTEHPEQKNIRDYSVKGRRLPKLTPKEAEVLSYIREDGLISSKALSARLNTTKRYARQLKTRLKKKGYDVERMFRAEQKTGGGAEHPEHFSALSWSGGGLSPLGDDDTAKGLIRAHAYKFEIEVLARRKGFPVGLVTTIRGHHVEVHERVVLVQQIEEEKGGFFGETVEEAHGKAMRYYGFFFKKLELDLRAVLLKERKQNIRCTYYEYASCDSPLSQAVECRGERLLVYKDGKLRFSTDRSDLYEHEYHAGPKRGGYADAKAGEIVINDLLDTFTRNPDTPTYSDMVKILNSSLKLQEGQTAAVGSIFEMLRPQKADREMKSEGLGRSKRWYHG